MASAKLVLGGAATAAVGVRVARSLYGRWRVLPDADRRSLETLAEDLKTRALELRGALDADRARSELRSASEASPRRWSAPREPIPSSTRRRCSACAPTCAASSTGSKAPLREALRLREVGAEAT